MVTEFQIFEAKQVGILYHWARFKSFKEILETDQMISRTLISLRNGVDPTDIPSWGNYISFSRNKKLNFGKRPVLIIFDGNKLSNKYKFESHLFTKDFEYKDEAEERIKVNIIPNIKKYIIGIKINKNELSNPTVIEYVEYLQSLIPNVKIEVVK